jgi:uncharacterized protein (DUF1501 family)
MTPPLSRRSLLGAGLAAALAPWTSLSFAGTGRPDGNRMVFVILRGGMDGLSIAPVPGDPDFAAARGPLAQFASAPLPLQGPFALHPQLVQMHAMYGRGELAVLHATGLVYKDRSHFDAQQVLESGGARPFQLTTGWMGRALAPISGTAIALDTAVPLSLRGLKAVDTWAPSTLADPSADLLGRLSQLYANDPALGQALARAQGLRTTGDMAATADERGGGKAGSLAALARKAGEFLSKPDGPQVAVLELAGWDSHANQAAANGPFTRNVRLLDEGMAALREAMTAPGAQGVWQRTVVVVATEFGREVAMNGTNGTDHGTGGAAFVLGGAVKGGRVVADWPGLKPADRYQNRDLRMTTDLRAVFKGLLSDHLHVARASLDRDVFPDSASVAPMSLLRA